MKNNLLSILFTAAVCALSIGCEPSNPTENSGGTPIGKEKRVPIAISTKIATKATDSAFETGDVIGLYVVNYSGSSAGTLAASGNHASNVSFSYSGFWTPSQTVYWKDQTTKADFYCYYPYIASVANTSALTFSVKADQSTSANYKSSEFLWGKSAGVAPTETPVQITVNHLMSNLIISLVAGNGLSSSDLESAKVEICSLKNNATINLANGSISATGSTTIIKPIKENNVFRALVVPQTVSNVDLIKITLGGKTFTLNQSLTLESNKQHTCTITLNNTGVGINVGIGNWIVDTIDHGGILD